jgi:FdhD protein
LQSQLYGIVNAIRVQQSIYKAAGSVHGCALCRGDGMLVFIEDVGRHNAIDTIAGWMWMNQSVSGQPMSGTDKVFYTTGRLTSEMVIKAAQMGVPIVVSRSGITEMGLQVAQRVACAPLGGPPIRASCATAPRNACSANPNPLTPDCSPLPEGSRATAVV